jgi:hypothetical protein
MSIKRFKEITKSQGLLAAIYKSIKYGPVIIASKLGRLIFKVNSKEYWNYRLLLNWSNAGGREQTKEFAESLFKNVNFKGINFNSVVDFGCALGDSSAVFRKYNKKLDIYLWDVSNVGLSKALKHNKKYNVKKWDRTTKADLIYCSNVIEHIFDTTTFVDELCSASKKWICVQGPFNETHPDGTRISPKNTLGEHIWTIDNSFIKKFLDISVFKETRLYIGDAPKAWPGGKQFYFFGKLRKPF